MNTQMIMTPSQHVTRSMSILNHKVPLTILGNGQFNVEMVNIDQDQRQLRRRQ